MLKRWLIILSLLLAVPLHTIGWANSTTVAKSQQQPEEVFLTFNYQNLFNKVVVALYEDGQFYLPVSNILSTLKVPHEVSVSPPVISGSYLDTENSFQLNFQSFKAQLKSKGEFSYNASKMLIRETDFYVTPEVFKEVFGLSFSVDFNNLLLELETKHELPVVSQFQRAQDRKKQERFSLKQDYYPLKYDRNRKYFSGGFLDYSLSANVNPEVNFYTYNLTLGTEVLGGDLQGSAFGSYSQNTTNFLTDNLRWRYAWRDNDAISQIYIGQTSTDGLFNRSFVGVRATNEPIEPRYIYDEIEIEGEAIPGSEVELYFNDALYDYKEINQNGQYRFLAPLTFGSSRLNLKIFDPAGGVREISRRIQVPFSFLRPGEFNYHVNVGRLQNPIFGSTEQTNMAQGDFAYGLTNWLTQKVGIEYLDQFPNQSPLVYGSTSARLFKEYLVNIDVAPNAFYRISTNAIYATSGSWDLEYTYYTGSGIYNTFGSEQEFSGNIYMPFNLWGVPLNVRLFGSHIIHQSNSQRTRYSVDLNTRLDRLNLRLRYSDLQSGKFQFRPSTSSEFITSATYYIGRTSSLPSFLEGTFVRGQVSYNPNLAELIQSDLQVSRNIFNNGRIQASFARNFRGNFNLFSLGVTIDFNGTRTSTTMRSSRDGSSFTQNVLGSVGYDDNTENVIFSNRQQVGRAATSVRLYVDKNNSGTYDPDEEVIKNNAVRIGRSGVTNMTDNGIIYLSQLQAYNRMNLEINQSAIKNPLLIPEIEKFSIVTDPNQYKPINIPFYTSGVISGKVTKTGGEPVSGLRVYLESKEGSFSKEMQTFSDGSFYAYEIPPDSYNLYIDNKQLEFLNAVSKPDTMNVRVEALAEGDFIEGLNFKVVPKKDPDSTSAKNNNAQISEDTSVSEKRENEVKEENLNYEIQLASFQTQRKAEQFAMEATQQLGGSFSVVKNTNNGLYAIRSVSIPNRNQAVETIISYHNSKYESAALVVLKNKDKAPVSTRSKFIQIGAYSTQKRAEAFANSSAKKLDQETAITYNKNSSLYKVYINKTFPSGQRMVAELLDVKTLYSFKKAFVNENGRIQIGAFKNQQNAENLVRESENILGKEASVFYDSQDNMYNVQLDEEYTSRSKRAKILAKIKNTPSPFHDAFVNTYEGSDFDGSSKKRAMKFTFQVEIEGVTESSEQAFLSSVLGNNTDTELERPEKDKIIFENVSTWGEAQILQRKLSRVSSIGHPIVILIEDN